jgi:uroporphyrinogen-III decarboxylase
VSSGVKLDHWCREELYDQYVIDLIKKERSEVALERSIKCMMDWADKNESVWNHYFSYASLSRATYDIKDGKISPWLILNCKTGKEMLKKFNDEQLAAISAVMDVPFWLAKFKKLPADVELIREVVKEFSL